MHNGCCTGVQSQLEACRKQIRAMEQDKLALQQKLDKSQQDLFKCKQVMARQQVSSQNPAQTEVLLPARL
jgi:uncharacterized protein (DUF3084 family)